MSGLQFEVLNASHFHAFVVDVDPVVREQVGDIDDERDGQKVAILQPVRGGDDRGRRRSHRVDEIPYRHRRDHMPRGQRLATAVVLDLEIEHTILCVMNGRDAAARSQASASSADAIGHGFPHHAGTQTRIVELFDERPDAVVT